MGKAKEDKGISRIASGSTKGWFVRGYKNSKTFSKLFSDRKCGGTENALDLARKHRDKLFDKLLSMPQKPRKRRIVFQDSRNATGVLGVCKTAKKGPNGKMNECYSVSWRPKPGVQKCTSFSIRRYGEKKAFEMAVSHRRKMIKDIYGSTIVKRMRETHPNPLS